jgi:hypothetical protein
MAHFQLRGFDRGFFFTVSLFHGGAPHGEITQETGRLAAMDLVEVNPALAKTEADLGRCRGRDPIQKNFQSFTIHTESINI